MGNYSPIYWAKYFSFSISTWAPYVVQPTGCICQLSNWCIKTSRRKTGGDPSWSDTDSAFQVFRPEEDQKCPSVTKTNRGKGDQYISACTTCEGFILINEAMNAEKWIWSTLGCKVWQIDPTAMKPVLDMSCHPLDVCTKFQRFLLKTELMYWNIQRATHQICKMCVVLL